MLFQIWSYNKKEMKNIERDDFSGSGEIPVQLLEIIQTNLTQIIIEPYQPKLSKSEWWCQVGMIVLFLSTGL